MVVGTCWNGHAWHHTATVTLQWPHFSCFQILRFRATFNVQEKVLCSNKRKKKVHLKVKFVVFLWARWLLLKLLLLKTTNKLNSLYYNTRNILAWTWIGKVLFGSKPNILLSFRTATWTGNDVTNVWSEWAWFFDISQIGSW